MKDYIVDLSALVKGKTFDKVFKLGAAIALLGSFSLASNAQQIVNGSFENGFTGWVTTAGDFIVGNPPNNPIGTSGVQSADVGGGDITGAILSQTVSNLTPGLTYILKFDSLAAVPDIALPQTATWNVTLSANSSTFLMQSYSQVATARPSGSTGFITRQLSFTVPINVQNVTISFVDTTPNGGVGIDDVFDSVSLNAVPEPGTLALVGMAGIAGLAFRKFRKS